MTTTPGSHTIFSGCAGKIRVINANRHGGKYLWAVSFIMMFFIVSTVKSHDDQAVVLDWQFNEGRGGKVRDSSGSEIEGAIHSVVWTEGVSGHGLLFDGLDSYVVCKQDKWPGIADDSFTIGAWFRVMASEEYQHIAGFPSVIQLCVSPQGHAECRLFNQSLSSSRADSYGEWRHLVNDGQWHYVAGVRDRREKAIYLYLDGKRVAAAVDSGGAIPENMVFRLGGAHADAGNASGFHGRMDDVKIHKRALDRKEIMSAWNVYNSSSKLAKVLLVERNNAWFQPGPEKNMISLLQASGVPCDRCEIDSFGVFSSGYDLAFVINGNILSDEGVAALKQFSAKGGKCFVCCSTNPAVNNFLGARFNKVSVDTNTGRYHARFTAKARKAFPGSPAQLILGKTGWGERAFNITLTDIEAEGEAIAYWHNENGDDTGWPALILSTNGILATQLLTVASDEESINAIVSLLARFIPEIWQEAADNLLNTGAGDNFYAHSSSEIDGMIRQREAKGVDVKKAREFLAMKMLFSAQCEEQLLKKDYLKAYASARKARYAAENAYYSLFHSQKDGLRVVLTGPLPAGGNWETTMRAIKENGFNTVAPCFSYLLRKEFLKQLSMPVPETLEKVARNCEECIKWARFYGVKVYAWLSGPEGFAYGNMDKFHGKNFTGKPSTVACISSDFNLHISKSAHRALISNYNFDGILWDIEKTICYCDVCRQRFEKETGVMLANWPKDVVDGKHADCYIGWQTGRHSFFCDKVCAEIRGRNSGIVLCACYNGGGPRTWLRDYQGLDPAQWLDEGIFDMFMPMIYHGDPMLVRKRTAEGLALVDGRIPFVPMLGLQHVANPVHLVDLIDIILNAGADGFALYEFANEGEEANLSPAFKALTLGATETHVLSPCGAPLVEADAMLKIR